MLRGGINNALSWVGRGEGAGEKQRVGGQREGRAREKGRDRRQTERDRKTDEWTDTVILRKLLQ